MTTIKTYLLDALGKAISCGGGFVSEEQYEARLNVCEGCDNANMVHPLPLVKTLGCIGCGCPFLVKPLTHKHCELDENYIPTGKKVLTICPHKEGNKWEEVDKQFENIVDYAVPLQNRIYLIKKIFDR